MRSFIVVVMLALVGCNNTSDNDSSFVTQAQLPPSESTQIAALRAEVRQLQLIGRPVGTPIAKSDQIETFRMLGEPTLAPSAVTVTGQFGPCGDMGVLQGRGGSDAGSPINSQFETFKTCTGYTYSISSLTGLLDVPPYLAWDGPNCTGNAYLEMDVPQNTMNADAVKNGLVFQSPLPNDMTVYQITSNQTPKFIFIQSAINSRPGSIGCSPDQEQRLVVNAIINTTQINGVPNSLTPGSWTTTAP